MSYKFHDDSLPIQTRIIIKFNGIFKTYINDKGDKRMNLKDTIQQHHAAQEFKDDTFTLEYANTGSHVALIKEIKAVNSDNSFPFKVQLTDDNLISYSYFPAKDTESADFADLVRYLDVLKHELLELDSANKIGHIAKVNDNEGAQIFYIDSLNVGEDMTINVYKQK